MVKVLIVDDEHDIVDLISFILKKQGFEILKAYTGADGLEIAGSVRPDLILLDLMLPNMDGYEIIQHLQTNEATRDIPIIILTAASSAEVKENLAGENIIGYLFKPFEPEPLLKMIGQCFTGSKKNG